MGVKRRREKWIIQPIDDYKRGLDITSLKDRTYVIQYWLGKPSHVMPIEVVIDGKSKSKHARKIVLKYHPYLK